MPRHTTNELEDILIKIIRPQSRRNVDDFNKKGGFFFKVEDEVGHRMEERDIAVGALRMIAGERAPPPGLSDAKALAADALKCVRDVGVRRAFSQPQEQTDGK